MFLLGTFVASNFDGATQQDIIDDIDFFAFPADQRRARPGRDRGADRRLHDGRRAGERGGSQGAARRPRRGRRRSTPTSRSNPSVVAANSDADTGGYNALQQKSAELVGSAKYIAQFLDRDTDPDFAANVVGPALADFIADPSHRLDPRHDVEEQKQTYTFE